MPLKQPPVLWCDNVGATYLASNPVFYAHTKHIEIDFHFVRDVVARKQIFIQFVSTKDNVADVLTKPLPLIKFKYTRDKLNVVPSSLIGLWGDIKPSDNLGCVD